MDPVTAVGLAGTVIQFVTFACSLLSAASEIHNSKTGIPTDLTNILNVHEQLQSFRARFIAQDDDATDALALRDHGDEVEGQTSSLGVLFRASEADCNRIIKLVEKLKIKSGPLRRWKSFKAALELVWRKGDIEELDKRLQRTQSALTLHICAMTSHYHQSYSADLRKLRDTSMRYQIAQTDKIEDMFRILQSLETRYLPAHYEQNRDRTSRKDPIFRPDEIDDLGQQIAELSVSVDSLTLQQDVLRSLNFDYRSLRHENIPLPHNRTFDWVYRTENLDNQHHLLEWLERGYGIFWVSGKPGSGKSTFMKFLADSPRTRKILDSWAYPRKVLVASHYFWNAGTDMQKSQQGLLREILFNILCQRPDLIHSIGPDTLSDPLSPIVHEWTIDELRKVLLKIATPGHNVQLCLFIDGLDEFSGDHQELCKDLKQLADASHVKICVSSRPWNAFQDAFGNHPLTTLRMQDFTEPDILAYVENQLSEHPRWSYLNDQPTSGSRLVQEVTRRAQGVFLWVVLVTKLLRQGLTNDDTFSDMLKRLEQFPSDLEPFFKQMLDSVDLFYHHKMAGALQIAIASEQPLRYPFYSFFEAEYDDKDYALNMKTETVAFRSDELKIAHSKVERRLECQCKGLLEVGRSHVNLLHRTVSDFLSTREMSDYLLSKSLPTFCPKLSILRATLAFLKNMSRTITERVESEYPVGEDGGEVRSQINHAIRLASEIEDESLDLLEVLEDILDDIELAICKLNAQSTPFIALNFPITHYDGAMMYFRVQLIKGGAVEYLRRKLEQDPDYFAGLDAPPLIALDYQIDLAVVGTKTNRMLELLLEHGQDPNEPYTSDSRDGEVDSVIVIKWTPWTFFLKESLYTSPTVISRDLSLEHYAQFRMFLNHGADRNGKIYWATPASASGVPSFSTAWYDYLFWCFTVPPDRIVESAYLEVLDLFFDGDINMDDWAYPRKNQPFHEIFFLSLRREMEESESCVENDPEREAGRSLINSRRASFWKAVALKLLIKAHGHDWPMDYIWWTIADLFGDKQRASMEARYASCLKITTIAGNKRAIWATEGMRDYETIGKVPRLT